MLGFFVFICCAILYFFRHISFHGMLRIVCVSVFCILVYSHINIYTYKCFCAVGIAATDDGVHCTQGYGIVWNGCFILAIQQCTRFILFRIIFYLMFIFFSTSTSFVCSVWQLAFIQFFYYYLHWWYVQL